MSGEPDPKIKVRGPKKLRRIIDRIPLMRKLLIETECRHPDCGRRATDPHHLILRSQGGDDVDDNILPLCRKHHDLVHAWDVDTRNVLGGVITDDEIRYVVRKLGFDPASDYFMRQWRRMLPTTFHDAA